MCEPHVDRGRLFPGLVTRSRAVRQSPRRMVKKLMRPRTRSISGVRRAVHDIESGLDALCLG